MSKYCVFTGVGTAVVTPFGDDGKVDVGSLEGLIEKQFVSEADAVVMTGTTGEAPTLSFDEKQMILELAVKKSREFKEKNGKKIPVIAGTGSNDTKMAVKQTQSAELAGADALLVVTPYYNKSSKEGLISHFAAISSSTSLPIIVYTVPQRTGVSLDMYVWRELAAMPNIVGVKDAGGDLHHTALLSELFGDELAIYSGDDDLTLPVLSFGGCGVISVTSNVVPKAVHEMCRLFFGGKNSEALDLWRRISPVSRALFCDVNPIPVKAMLSELGLCRPHLRMPLVPLSEEKRAIIRTALSSVKALNELT